MRCSIIISVLDSHEIFRRQMLRFNRIVPADFEVIVLDDGSEVPLEFDGPLSFPFRLVATNDKRPWTSEVARNLGARLAVGEYLLMTDIDHILTPEALEAVLSFRGDLLKFSRRKGRLDERGCLSHPGEALHPHVNTFAVKKSLFDASGGYDEQYRGYGNDRSFRGKYDQMVKSGLAEPPVIGPEIYVITEQKWFHNLSRNQESSSC